MGKPSLTNNLDETTYRADAWKTENTLTYDNTFNDMHTVGVLLSTTADHYSKRGLEVNGKDLSDESAYLQYLSYANSVSATDYLTGPDANVSLIARLAYSFNDRYFVTASWARIFCRVHWHVCVNSFSLFQPYGFSVSWCIVFMCLCVVFGLFTSLDLASSQLKQ